VAGGYRLAPVPAGTFLYNANDELQTDAYDANGNTVNSGGLGYAYDFENRLVQQRRCRSRVAS
jgi:hypothetical protein